MRLFGYYMAIFLVMPVKTKFQALGFQCPPMVYKELF